MEYFEVKGQLKRIAVREELRTSCTEQLKKVEKNSKKKKKKKVERF